MLITIVLLFTSCSASHYVAQSASSYTKGDTTVTIIKYEQTGKIRK
nr:MAG TPA: Lysis protein [Microviridae sp.]